MVLGIQGLGVLGGWGLGGWGLGGWGVGGLGGWGLWGLMSLFVLQVSDHAPFRKAVVRELEGHEFVTMEQESNLAYTTFLR